MHVRERTNYTNISLKRVRKILKYEFNPSNTTEIWIAKEKDCHRCNFIFDEGRRYSRKEFKTLQVKVEKLQLLCTTKSRKGNM